MSKIRKSDRQMMRISFGLSRRNGIIIGMLAGLVAGVAAIFLIVLNMAGEAETKMLVSTNLAVLQNVAEPDILTKRHIKLVTLNIAHGRKDGPNQIFQKARTIKSHLDEIAMVVKREKPDVLALQEADGPSIWSGELDQVKYLADKALFPYYIHGQHVKGMKIRRVPYELPE
jgi:hypothetical protein